MTIATRTPPPTTTRQRKQPARTPADALRLETLRAEREKLERSYYLQVVLPLEAMGYPRAVPQVKLLHNRKLTWDYAYYEARVAVEIQGAIWKGARGGHSSGAGITRDAEKINELACIGWRALVFTDAQIADGKARDWTERALRAAGLRSTR